MVSTIGQGCLHRFCDQRPILKICDFISCISSVVMVVAVVVVLLLLLLLCGSLKICVGFFSPGILYIIY